MNEISKQVTRARRRLWLGRFFQMMGWSLFAGLLLAVVAIAIPKIWHLPMLESENNYQTWVTSWIAGGVAAGFLVALTGAFLRRESQLSAAVEVDQRFKLKERLSSALSLSESERESEAGHALVQDASSRAATIDIRDRFQIQPTWKAAMPLIPIVALAILMLLPNAVATAEAGSESGADAEKKSAIIAEETRQKLKKKLEEMEAKGLKNAKLDIDSLEKKIDNLSSESQEEKRDTLIKLNNIKKQLDERRKELGDSDALKQQLQQMKEVSKGPAKQLSDALSQGEFDEAKKAIKDLVEKLKKGELNQIEQKKLADDLKAMADQLEQLAQDHEKKKQELQKKIDDAVKNGDMQQAAKLQQKLDQMKERDQQMQKMQNMAQQMKQCADCMKQGNGQQKQGNGQQKQGQKQQGQQPGEQSNQNAQAQMQQAAQSLEDLAEQIEKMQQEMEELQDLEEMMEEISEAKNQFQGGGNEDGKPGWQDWAQGKGRGGGKRDRQEEDTGNYKSQVKAKLQKGETVVTGSADGDNISGKSFSEVRSMVKSNLNKKSDPLENQKLPRSQREHVKEYFNRLRSGN